MEEKSFDYVIIGSGFGGSVAAMRLSEKGYSVLVLEKGKRFEDEDFPKSNHSFWKYVWMPALRCFGILQISILKGVMVLHGAGVGGGSLGYANVLETPPDETFATPAWNEPLAWGEVLKPHFSTARNMLGVAPNPRLWKGDEAMRAIAAECGNESTFRPTEVGIFFGEEEVTVPDPYFDGSGPARTGCRHCGGCMVGCRYNAKNTLPKNYLYFAEQHGAEIWAECAVNLIRPTKNGDSGYEITYSKSTDFLGGRKHSVFGRQVIIAAGVLGTMKLLLDCRDHYKSLPQLSRHLGEKTRTNSEALLGSVARSEDVDYSKGIAIPSIFKADEVTRIEPVRYPAGSDLMKLLQAPLISHGDSIPVRLVKSIGWLIRHPLDFLRVMVKSNWAKRATIILVMQNVDNSMRIRLGRSVLTLFRRGLVAEPYSGHSIHARVNTGHDITRSYASKSGGVPLGSLGENLLNLPTTAHILGGCPMGVNAEEGVVDKNFAVHNYPGMYVMDASVMPSNLGVNPSLTITALAEYGMSKIPQKADNPV